MLQFHLSIFFALLFFSLKNIFPLGFHFEYLHCYILKLLYSTKISNYRMSTVWKQNSFSAQLLLKYKIFIKAL